MGDIRFARHYELVRDASDPASTIRSLADEDLVAALAGASQDQQPYLANVLATELTNRVRRQAAITEAAGEGLCALDRAGNLTFLNAAGQHMLGRARGEVLGLHMHEIVHAGTSSHAPDAPCPLSSPHAPRTPRGWQDDLFSRAGAPPIPVAWCSAPLLRDGELEGIVVVFQDTTEQRRAQEEIAARSRRLVEQQRALVTLAKSEPLHAGDAPAMVQQLTRTCARILGVERVSVWWYDASHAYIRCDELWEATGARRSSGTRLNAADYPAYFEALDDERAIAADDARTDPRTSEFLRTYLEPLGITSMLDVPVRVAGEIVGIVCHEHVGPARAWTADEQAFAAAAADLLALTIETRERREAEEEATRHRTFLHALLNAAPNPIFAKDLEGRYLFANAAVAELYGTTVSALVGKTDADFGAVDEEIAAFRAADRTVIDTGQEMAIPEEPFTNPKTGQTRWFQTIKVPLRDPDGVARHVLGVATDITELRRIGEEERAFVAHSPYLMGVAGKDGYLSRVNPAWEKILGYTSEELTSRPYLDLVHPDDRASAAAALDRVLAGKIETAYSARLLAKDGRYVRILWDAFSTPERGLLFGVGRVAR